MQVQLPCHLTHLLNALDEAAQDTTAYDEILPVLDPFAHCRHHDEWATKESHQVVLRESFRFLNGIAASVS